MYKQLLAEIQQYLDTQTFNNSNTDADGRLNSNTDEKGIVSLLKKHFGDRLKEMSRRAWCDVVIDGFPFNIKSTQGTASDNAANYKALRYAFIDEEIDFDTGNNKSKDIGPLLSRIEKVISGYKIPDLERDYGFIVFNKIRKDFTVAPLKSVSVKQNPSNLPFQIKWNDNQNWTHCTDTTEAFKKIVIEPLEAVNRSFEVRVFKCLNKLT